MKHAFLFVLASVEPWLSALYWRCSQAKAQLEDQVANVEGDYQ